MSYEWFQELLGKLPFQLLDYLVISLNLLIFLFAKFIIKISPKATYFSTTNNRMLGLRAINLALFSIYMFAAGVEIIFDQPISHLQQISQTGLTVLVAYIIQHYVQGWVVYRFGKAKEIDGVTYHGESYASEIIGLIGLVLVSSFAILVIINIWELNEWLQATSVIGGILLILFASKEYFLGDMISGLIMHYNHSVEAGSVIRVKELDTIGVVLQITLSQTIIRDLVQKHEVTIPNSKLRNSTVETISNCGKNGFREFLDFKIGYDQPSEKVQTFLEKVWEQAAAKEAGINIDAKPKIVVIENGDHAVTWRLLFYIKNPYRLLDSRNTMQTIAFELSHQENIGLNTPVTHQILGDQPPELDNSNNRLTSE
ncbi:mechanosensitive ion channel domain-containing protein [Aliikangiella coralliicola]|uniref:Small-conductance mechanosensitive channel n=1 Tax=Aliikangiella coralliicola TaxID=2592383 RepID=A0A545UJF9_9GAMM|nr:mechanosensitive ion channel domain-containing protein [Aliikangiella coralliicola]TQV89607.1 mechanosensitive ion channel [Aliikangiella coralliicola]